MIEVYQCVNDQKHIGTEKNIKERRLVDSSKQK